MKKILIILSLFFLSSSYTLPPSCTSSTNSVEECLNNRKVMGVDGDCCFINFIYKYYEHDVNITMCYEILKDKELKDFVKEQEEYYKKSMNDRHIYKKIICKKRSFTKEE